MQVAGEDGVILICSVIWCATSGRMPVVVAESMERILGSDEMEEKILSSLSPHPGMESTPQTAGKNAVLVYVHDWRKFDFPDIVWDKRLQDN